MTMRRLFWVFFCIVLYSCTKEVVVAQEIRVVDTVYVTETKIYTDTLHISDTIVRYGGTISVPFVIISNSTLYLSVSKDERSSTISKS